MKGDLSKRSLTFQHDEYSVITIKRKGGYEKSTMTEIYNNHIYAGHDNDLLLSRIYTTSFTCNFKMALYPFDVQECNMIFIMKVIKHVTFIESKFYYNPPFSTG